MGISDPRNAADFPARHCRIRKSMIDRDVHPPGGTVIG